MNIGHEFFIARKESHVRKIWLITGAARGFGRVWTQAALKRGMAFLHSAPARWPRRGEPQGSGEQSNAVRLRVRESKSKNPAIGWVF